MSTVKNVIYNLINPHSEALACYYNEYRIEENEGIKGYKVESIYLEDYDFWVKEFTSLQIDESVYIDALTDLYHELRKGNYIDAFESIILPILLEHWKFIDE